MSADNRLYVWIMPVRYKDSVCQVLKECLEVVLKVSQWCLDEKNVSKSFIGGIQGIFCRYFTGDRTVFCKYQELDTFCRISVSLVLL